MAEDVQRSVVPRTYIARQNLGWDVSPGHDVYMRVNEMADAKTLSEAEANIMNGQFPIAQDADPAETAEWMSSLEYVLKSKGAERVKFLLSALDTRARREGVDVPLEVNTAYVNTIPTHKQPPYPGNRELERRIKSIIRWNAMAMVVRGNKKHEGIGGHISTFASSATLYEVGFYHNLILRKPRMNEFLFGKLSQGYINVDFVFPCAQ